MGFDLEAVECARRPRSASVSRSGQQANLNNRAGNAAKQLLGRPLED